MTEDIVVLSPKPIGGPPSNHIEFLLLEALDACHRGRLPLAFTHVLHALHVAHTNEDDPIPRHRFDQLVHRLMHHGGLAE